MQRIFQRFFSLSLYFPLPPLPSFLSWLSSAIRPTAWVDSWLAQILTFAKQQSMWGYWRCTTPILSFDFHPAHERLRHDPPFLGAPSTSQPAKRLRPWARPMPEKPWRDGPAAKKKKKNGVVVSGRWGRKLLDCWSSRMARFFFHVVRARENNPCPGTACAANNRANEHLHGLGNYDRHRPAPRRAPFPPETLVGATFPTAFGFKNNRGGARRCWLAPELVPGPFR